MPPIAASDTSSSDIGSSVEAAIAACGGDARATVARLLAEAWTLDAELSELYARSSRGYLRGRRVVQETLF
jgi:hypothetical protein